MVQRDPEFLTAVIVLLLCILNVAVGIILWRYIALSGTYQGHYDTLATLVTDADEDLAILKVLDHYREHNRETFWRGPCCGSGHPKVVDYDRRREETLKQKGGKQRKSHSSKKGFNLKNFSEDREAAPGCSISGSIMSLPLPALP